MARYMHFPGTLSAQELRRLSGELVHGLLQGEDLPVPAPGSEQGGGITGVAKLPDVGATPLVSDTSSDMFSRPLEVSRHALIYAGAQKNMGPAGVTIVIIRDDLVSRSKQVLLGQSQ